MTAEEHPNDAEGSMTAGKDSVYLALLHHPVYNRNREVVTSAITNLDIHDIARIARTYSLGGYFLVTPDREQQRLARSICDHWLKGYGSRYNIDRSSALRLVQIADTLERVIEWITVKHDAGPEIFATTASEPENMKDKSVSFDRARKILSGDASPSIILLGTGWGVTGEVLKKADYILRPIEGVGSYNHLSVRAAAAIIVDRLFGREASMDS